MIVGASEASSNLRTMSYSLLQNIAEVIGNIIGWTGIPMKIIKWLSKTGVLFP